MSSWVPLYIPLVRGLDLSKETVLGGDELRVALNVDYGPGDAIKGRPSRVAAKQVAYRTPVAAASDPSFTTAAFNSTGFTPRGLMRIQDGSGERGALGCEGRLFTQEGSTWNDRGYFNCTKVNRQHNYQFNLTGAARKVAAPDFGLASFLANGYMAFDLLDTTGAHLRQYRLAYAAAGQVFPGNGARCGTTTALVVVGDDAFLKFIYRVNGGTTLTMVNLASDARSPGDTGDAPVICCSADATNFWVAYRSTTTNVLKVLNVSITGTVNATYTSAAITDLEGFWIDNTTTATNRLMLAFTDSVGVTLRTLNATTMADLSVDSTYSPGAAGVGLDVVVGCESATKCWWGYRHYNLSGSGDLHLGIATIGTAASASLMKVLYGSGSTEASIRWSLVHQPVLVNGRLYLTLAAATGTSLATAGTWLTLDLSHWSSLGSGDGLFSHPGVVARGPTQGTYPLAQPSTAVAHADGSGWLFPTQDWARFELNADGTAITGIQGAFGMTEVTFSGPKAAALGSTTVFSGSVPRMVAGGSCVELGFPFLAGIPGIATASPAGAGSVAAGSYSVIVCWRWTDESGQIHRSSPSATSTVTVSTTVLQVVATNPWLSEKSDVKIEIYVTDVNPTADGSHYLQSVVTPDPSAAYTSTTLTAAITTTTEAIYTDGDEFANVHVPADGGVAAVGRRLWVADGSRAYASKLHVAGYAPGFNDEAVADQPSLAVAVPAAAGRITALEALDDKLLLFCTRGVYVIQDGGPDNTGRGMDFAAPLRVAELGIAGPRSSCTTDAGIAFCSTLDSTDASRGGPWLITRQLSPQYLGRPAIDYYLRTSSWVPEVAFSAERQQLYITTPVANGASHGVVVLDLRVEKWAIWDTTTGTHGNLRHITCVSGVLWALNNEPAPYSGAPGSDATGAYVMLVKTARLASNGQDGVGWSRVRAISPREAEGTTTHTLTVTAILDGTRTHTSGSLTRTTPSADTTWPATDAPEEWRLPVQKCSSIQVQLSATPATARWAAIRLDVAPLPRRAPARNRS